VRSTSIVLHRFGSRNAVHADEEEDLESALQKAKTQKDGVSLPPISGGAATKSEPFAVAQTTDRRDPEKKAVGAACLLLACAQSLNLQEVTERPTVVDDFIRNFLIKIGMKKTLETFQVCVRELVSCSSDQCCLQTEWYELKAKGKLNPEDVGVVPDIYARNEKLDDQVSGSCVAAAAWRAHGPRSRLQVKQLRLEVDKSKALAEYARCAPCTLHCCCGLTCDAPAAKPRLRGTSSAASAISTACTTAASCRKRTCSCAT
jgi:hypothetical protein